MQKTQSCTKHEVIFLSRETEYYALSIVNYQSLVNCYCLFRPRSLGQIMKIDFDPEVDTAYLQLDNAKIIESEEVLPGVVFDFNLRGDVVGVEISSGDISQH